MVQWVARPPMRCGWSAPPSRESTSPRVEPKEPMRVVSDQHVSATARRRAQICEEEATIAAAGEAAPPPLLTAVVTGGTSGVGREVVRGLRIHDHASDCGK